MGAEVRNAISQAIADGRYLLLDGTNTMSGNLDMGTNDITNVGLVDGVDVSVLDSDFTIHDGGTAYSQHTGGLGDHTHQSSGAEGGQVDHGLGLTGLLDDDHTQYALLAGRAGGQTFYGGTAASEILALYGSTDANLGQIHNYSPFYPRMSSIIPALLNPAYAFFNNETINLPASVIVMGMIESNANITINHAVWFSSQISEKSTYIAAVAPSFAAFTLFNAFPVIANTGYVGTTTMVGNVGVQISVTHRNSNATATVTAADTGFLYRPRVDQALTGGSMTKTVAKGLQCLPLYDSVVGGSAGFTALYSVNMANPDFTNHKGTTILGTYAGLKVENITNKLSSSIIAGIENDLVAGTNNYLIKDDGGAQSYLSGDLWFVTNGSGLPFGEIYEEGNATTMSVSSSGYTQVTIFGANGQSNLSTPDYTNDHITIDKAGKYQVTVSLSVENQAGVGHTIDIEVRTNNGVTAHTNLHASRELSSGTDLGSISISGLADFSATDTVEVWITSDSATARNITVEDINLTIVQVGG